MLILFPSALEKRRKNEEAFEKVIHEKETVSALFVRFNNMGIPRSGKTTFWRRLTRKPVEFSNGDIEEPSTGMAVCHSQVILKKASDTTTEGAHSTEGTSAASKETATNGKEDTLADKEASVTVTESSVGMGLIDSEDDIWSELSHGQEVALINQIFSEIARDSSTVKEPFTSERDTTNPGNVSMPHQEISGNVSIPQEKGHPPPETISDPVLRNSPSPQINEDMEEIISVLDEAMESSVPWDKSKVKTLLERLILLTSTDTGGHAEFQDMHASLISGPSFNLLFSRLTDGLRKNFKVYFTKDDGTSIRASDPSVSTVRQVLFQSLASIACFGNCFCTDDSTSREDPETKMKIGSSRSKVMLVGTFEDQVKNKQAIKKRDDELMDMIQGTWFYENIVVKAEEDQIMLTVGKDSDMDKIRGILMHHIKKLCTPITIPASWLVLSLCLRLYEPGVMTFENCRDLAKRLKIDTERELKLALWFLHYVAGVLHYFPDVVGDTVFCRAEVVYNCVSDLIKAYSFDNVNSKCETFQNQGKFSLKAIREDIPHLSIELEKFIKILKHLNIITAVPHTEEMFFMPCVLKSLGKKELKIPHCESDPPHLMLQYECGYTPVGVFPAMITNLVSQRKWRVIEKYVNNKVHVYKNKVHFRIGDHVDDIILISHPRYFEIAISSKGSDPTICNKVCSIITATLEEVILKMNYKFDMKYRFGFECPCCNFDCSDEDQVHLALLPKETSSHMECSKNPEKTKGLETSHKQWFSEPQGKVVLYTYHRR